jgi:hypothetical protein
LADYYNWKIDEEVDDKIYAYVTIEDLSRMLLDSKSDYIDMLSIDMSDIYDNSDPDNIYNIAN